MTSNIETATNLPKVVMSGIRPTGFLHLGNYFGAIKNYVRLQDDFPCYFMVADLHSLTTHPDTATLKQNVHRVLAENIACGLDPGKAAFYCQSHVRETGELYLYLNMLAYMGELEKTVTFKDKARQHPENINAGLLTYPVLQAADIIIHRASHVPVGKDQEQHLEMARNFVQRFNYRYGNVFPEPVAYNFNEKLVKVPALDGTGKMSKSENEMSTIFLADDDATIIKKVKKIKTDGGPQEKNETIPASIQLLFDLMALVSTEEVIEKFKTDFANASIRYGDMKGQLAGDMAAFVAPIRQKAADILADKAYLEKVMKTGAEKANESANATLKLVRAAMGLNYF